MNFGDPTKTSDGKIWAKERYLEIIKARQYISSRINTSYYDLGKITPFERDQILRCISDGDKATKEEIDRLRKEHKK